MRNRREVVRMKLGRAGNAPEMEAHFRLEVDSGDPSIFLRSYARGGSLCFPEFGMPR